MSKLQTRTSWRRVLADDQGGGAAGQDNGRAGWSDRDVQNSISQEIRQSSERAAQYGPLHASRPAWSHEPAETGMRHHSTSEGIIFLDFFIFLLFLRGVEKMRHSISCTCLRLERTMIFLYACFRQVSTITLPCTCLRLGRAGSFNDWHRKEPLQFLQCLTQKGTVTLPSMSDTERDRHPSFNVWSRKEPLHRTKSWFRHASFRSIR